jgi:hypothetical protein
LDNNSKRIANDVGILGFFTLLIFIPMCCHVWRQPSFEMQFPVEYTAIANPQHLLCHSSKRQNPQAFTKACGFLFPKRSYATAGYVST